MEETEAVVREYVAACNGGDVEAVCAVMHPDVELHEAEALPGAVSAVGLDEVRHYISSFGTHWSYVRWEPLELRIRDHLALMRANLVLTGRQSGLNTEREWLYLFEVRDGKLFRQYGYDDMVAAETALAQGGR